MMKTDHWSSISTTQNKRKLLVIRSNDELFERMVRFWTEFRQATISMVHVSKANAFRVHNVHIFSHSQRVSSHEKKFPSSIYYIIESVWYQTHTLDVETWPLVWSFCFVSLHEQMTTESGYDTWSDTQTLWVHSIHEEKVRFRFFVSHRRASCWSSMVLSSVKNQESSSLAVSLVCMQYDNFVHVFIPREYCVYIRHFCDQ